MLALLSSSEISLAPDATLFTLLAIFLSVSLALSFFVFRPVLKIIDRRRAETAGALAKAEEIKQQTQILEKKIEEALVQARLAGAALREEIKKSGQAQARQILQEAKTLAQKEYETAKHLQEKMAATAEAGLFGQVNEFSKMILNRLVHRENS